MMTALMTASMSVSMTWLLVLCSSLPWVVAPVVLARRVRRSVSLDEFDEPPDELPGAPPAVRVSIVLPARNEARHIGACVASLMATTWPDVEIIVVDDHSSDDTSRMARETAGNDPRVRVISAPPLPDGWFGKQWACHVGSRHATGDHLLFTDADTRHAPDLLSRAERARSSRNVDLLSVAGHQELVTFWELAIQPIVFTMILARYGGTRELEQARYPQDVIANGQCLLVTRTAYDAIGGHEAVRMFVAEDLMLAQHLQESGRRLSLVLGRRQLSTRMYDDFMSLARGWMKNVYAGGRLAMRGGPLPRLLYPLVLVSFPLLVAAPFIALLVALGAMLLGAGLPTAVMAWSAVAASCTLAYFAAVHAFGNTSPWRTFTIPLGALAFTVICIVAVIRGRHVEWKDRHYTSR